MSGLRILPFLSFYGKTKKWEVEGVGGWLNYLPSSQIKVNFWNLVSGFFSISGNKKGKELLKNFTSF